MRSLKGLQKMSLLYVEDDLLVLEENLEIFHNFFGEICSCSDGALAKVMIEERFFDLYIFDIRLPHINGIELSSIVKKRDANAKIIITSSYEEVNDLKEFIKLGVVIYLTKPFSLEELMSALERCVPQEKEKRLVNLKDDRFFDRESGELFISGDSVALSINERKLLFFALHSKKSMLTYEEISINVYEWKNYENSVVSIRNLIYRLNKKIGYKMFEGISGLGYKVLL